MNTGLKTITRTALCILRKTFTIVVVAAIITSINVATAGSNPHQLLCEWNSQPLNVERPSPRLSWQSKIPQQQAYQIHVATSPDRLTSETPDLWDSGKVVSSSSLNIGYDGKPLVSRQGCHWRVRVWANKDGQPGQWSEPAKWEMGLLNPDDWTAKWIRASDPKLAESNDALNRWYELAGHSIDKNGNDQVTGAERLRGVFPATWFRKTFTVSKPIAKARLYSTAGGYVETFLDGKKISDRVMNPAQTDFQKRILYDADAVEDLLEQDSKRDGQHTLSAHLGEGFYGQNVAFNPRFRYGPPLLIMQLELTFDDGSTQTIATDDSWLTHPSPIIKNNVYAGEVYDARLELQDKFDGLKQQANYDWKPAAEANESPTERLEPQLLPPVTKVRDIVPVAVLNPRPDVWVFDFGQNFTGLATLNLSETSLSTGQAVYLRYSEWADEEGNINQSSDGAFATTVHQVDCYIAGDENQASWTPSFTWHGFRYVEVTGLSQPPTVELLTGHLIRSGVSQRGTFASSDPHLNRIHDTAVWTYESNLISIPSDCPIRERCGWTGDAHATVTMSNCNFDMAAFWEKYLDDFRTNDQKSPCIVPGKRGASSTPDWAVAQVLIAWEHYLNYADKQTLAEHYSRLQDFMAHYHSLQKDGIIPVGYGDWCDPVKVPGTPRVGGAGKPQWTIPAITTTALFVHASKIMSQIAAVLNDNNGKKTYDSWSQTSAQAFHKKFFDVAKKTYGSQTADSMALSFGIVPDELRDAVADSLSQNVTVDWRGHASVGALGHPWLYLALADAGYADTALGTFHAKGHPGFHYLFDDLNGTSLWERKGAFDPATMEAPDRSLSHPFQGGYDSWFFQGLGGIRPDPEKPGYQHFFLQPVFPKNLDWVQVDFETHYGTIKSHWKRIEDKIQWTVTVPPNTSATIKVQDDSVSGRVLPPGEHVLNVSGIRIAEASKPNVIIILADDLGIVDTNAYAARFTGADKAEMYYETPNIDQLVKEGMAFSQAYACHLCSPTRASLLTGKYAARTGFTTAVGGNVRTFYNQAIEPPKGYVAQDALVWQDKIEIQQALLNGTTRDALASGHSLDNGQDETTLAEAMPNHQSAFIGKWHLGGHGSEGWQPSSHGFEEISYLDEGGSPYFNWRAVWDSGELLFPKTPQERLRRGKSGKNFHQEYLTDELTEHAVDFIRSQASSTATENKPFFLHFSHFAVHTPFQGRADDVAHFEQKSTRGWNGHDNPIYAAMLKRLDISVGRILDTLESTGLDENTLVVFISDNGGVTYTDPVATNNAPFKGGKALHFEGGIRVPMVIRWKGQVEGDRWCNTPVDCNDVFPTVLEMAGYDISQYLHPGGIDGRSITSLFDDPTNTDDEYPRDTFFWHYPLNVVVINPEDGLPSAPSSAIREREWKLIFDWSGKLRLYNIADDPFEKNELSASMPKKARDLFVKLNDWIDQNVDIKYTPAINPDYDASEEARNRPFIDLRHKYLGEQRAIRTTENDPRFKLIPSGIPGHVNQSN
ncbi:Arylsulfatase [Rubripirellula obstinata]|uniref:alpha-L-rhamnosidase n=1 Tax=Rubripirellula obstinata TaxID=406547 RepID=A0A5B1CLV2_9BACT|nr:family 78 glycoside hydrolase catalytic domain [Rubripirellula obstinata]KAA1261312.1 Arylsulfatase [Rubripirellula obstinata]